MGTSTPTSSPRIEDRRRSLPDDCRVAIPPIARSNGVWRWAGLAGAVAERIAGKLIMLGRFMAALVVVVLLLLPSGDRTREIGHAQQAREGQSPHSLTGLKLGAIRA
jgi:hypothetical protein